MTRPDFQANPEAFRAAIPSLVESSITRGEKSNKGRVDTEALLQEAHVAPTFHTGVDIIEACVNFLEKDLKGKPKYVKSTLDLMNNIAIIMMPKKDEPAKRFNITQKTSTQAYGLYTKWRKLSQMRYVERVDEEVLDGYRVTGDSETFSDPMDKVLDLLRAAHQAGNGGKSYIDFPPVDQRVNAVQGLNIGEKKAFSQEELMAEISREEDSAIRVPKILRFFRNMHFQDGKKFFDDIIAGTSMQDIEDMEYPLSSDNILNVNSYLKRYFDQVQARGIEAQPLYEMMKLLAGYPMMLNGERAPKIPENDRKLLANFASWREGVTYALFRGLAGMDRRISVEFGSLDPNFTQEIILGLTDLVLYPHASDPFFDGKDFTGIIDRHPIAKIARQEYLKTHSFLEWEYFADYTSYFADFGKNILKTQIADAMNQNGPKDPEIPENVKAAFNTIFVDRAEQYLEDDKEHFKTKIESQFSPTKMDILNQSSTQVSQKATGAWNDITQRGMDYLPLQNGVDIIDFSEGSMPNSLNIESLVLNRSTDAENWHINLRFNLLFDTNTIWPVIGKINQDGSFKITSPQGAVFEGLSSMMHLIAVSAAKDLCVREEKRDIVRRVRATNGQSTSPTESREYEISNSDRSRESAPIPREIVVRQHKDIDLEAEIMPKRDPRLIGVHGMKLQGTDSYVISVRDHLIASSRASMAAKAGNETEWETWEKYAEELAPAVTEAREKMFRISELKDSNWPDELKRRLIKDPLDKKTYSRNTWVVEHTTPRVNEEEEQELVLWKRHYKPRPEDPNGEPRTALGRLDQDFADLLQTA